MPNMALVMFDGSTNFPLIAIPLFILAGAIMNSTGISRRLITFTSALLGFIKGGYRELHWQDLKKTTIEGGVQTAVVMLLVASSALVGVYLTETQVPQNLASAISSMTENRYVVLALLNIFLLIVGLFLHSAAAIILVVPIVIPLVLQVGIDPVHFGIIVTLNLAIGQQTPPVASVLVTACSVGKADIWEVSKVNIYFVAVLFIVLMLVTYVPIIPMALVEFFYR